MVEAVSSEVAVRQALDELTVALEAFAQAYAAWAADPDADEAAVRLEAAEAQVDVARQALDALERAMAEHR